MAMLLTCEVVTNAVVHAHSDVEVVVQAAGAQVRVAVTDHGPGMPELRHPSELEPSGRGLLLVSEMASSWGTKRAGRSKTVWFCLDPS